MKSNLEKIISDNHDFFNQAEPKEGHFERFEAKLKKNSVSKKKFKFRIIWQVAAAIVFIFLAVNQAIIYFSPKNVTENTQHYLPSEYQEIETYYVTAINNNLTNWENLKKQGTLTDEEKSLLNTELKEFDETLKNIQEELNANPDDERVINAMIEFYQSKLNVITIIVENMKEVKQIKNKNHDTEI